MSPWLEQVIGHAQAKGAPLPFQETAFKQSLDTLTNTPWPTRKTENWRFTSLTALENRALSVDVSQSDNAVSTVSTISDLDCIDIEFEGSRLLTDVAAISLPAGVEILDLSQATTQQASTFNQIKPQKHLFGLVNDTIANAAVVINVADGVVFDTPIRFIHKVSKGIDNHSRLLVNVGENAKLTVIEQGEGNLDSANTSFAEYDVKANGELQHYRFAMFTEATIHAGGSHFRLAEKAYMNSTIVGFGSAISRLDIDVIYTGEHANADINAMYLLAEGENFDLQTTIEHAVPHCTTEENVRGIVGDRAKANFNGRIHIHRDAQKTLAELNNRNLLLSRRGQINTKPELEIYADDVKCAHGATIAEIEEQALYYLLSRGISRSQALIMLNFGFIQELINDIKLDAIRDWLTGLLRNRFSKMEVK